MVSTSTFVGFENAGGPKFWPSDQLQALPVPYFTIGIEDSDKVNIIS